MSSSTVDTGGACPDVALVDYKTGEEIRLSSIIQNGAQHGAVLTECTLTDPHSPTAMVAAGAAHHS
jgi:hypothetical protein